MPAEKVRQTADQRCCYVIAEAGVNHNGSLEKAKKLVDVAVASGADAVKFQSFVTENIITRYAPKARYHVETTGDDASGSWFELLKSQELDRSDHEELLRYCASLEIDFLSTPYDEDSVDLLDSLDVKGFKVASTDANNVPLIRHIASKRRPVILSTAMCELEEVKNSIFELRSHGADDLTVLQCTGSYPAPAGEANLLTIGVIGKECRVRVGYSDHVEGGDMAIAAVALGAQVYEKHITLDRSLPGPDHRASLEPEEFRQLVQRIRSVELALGDGFKRVMPCERENRNRLRKFIVAKSFIAQGEVIASTQLTTKRTGGKGLEATEWDSITGMTAKKDLTVDKPIEWSDLSLG